MDLSKFDSLLNRYFDGELSPDERDELQLFLLSAPEVRQDFWRKARLHGSLRLLEEQESGACFARRDSEEPGEKKVISMGRKLWIGAAAAAVILLFVIGFDRWQSGGGEKDPIASGGPNSPETLTVESSNSRPRLSDRLFANHKPRFSSDRVTATRNRVRQLRINLNQQPTSRL